VVKVSASGIFLSGPTGFTDDGGLSTPHGLALDAFDHVWVATAAAR
jgi:hypothetical protein